MIPVSFYTLGCKLNQLETEAVSASFADAGFTVVPWSAASKKTPPSLCVINTCTVTSKAEQKARRVIRLCLNSGAVVLVTGCYAQLGEAEILRLGKESADFDAALFSLPGRKKDKLLTLPRYLAETLGVFSLRGALARWLADNSPDSSNPFAFNPDHFSFHSRAFLKIQDGCNKACAYCRVPLARGKSVSLEPEEALKRLRALENAGMAEAVLTGVNICQYLDPAPSGKKESARRLPFLLAFLLDNTKHIRIRLSSIEVEPELFAGSSGVSEAFFETLKNPRIRNHFHLSVQSGSGAVLSAMGRPYTARDILWTAEKLKTIRDDPFLACDIITGFPGESEDDFEQTLTLCREAGFAWIHAFPYSKRPGTGAASITKGIVSEKIAGERVRFLLELAQTGKAAYVRRWRNKVVEAVAESPLEECRAARKPENFSPFFSALTDNYIKVRVSLEHSRERPIPGTPVLCAIEKPNEENSGGFDAWARLA